MKTKLFIWMIAIVTTAVVMLQNNDIFFKKVPLGLDLFFVRFQTAGLPTAVIVIGFFFAGYLVSQIIGLAEHHRLKTTVDTLKEVVIDQCATHKPKPEPMILKSKREDDEDTENSTLVLEATNESVQAS